MRWTRGHRSEYVEDRRNERGASMLGGGRTTLLVWLFSRFGLPGLLIGAAALYFLSSSSDTSSNALSSNRSSEAASEQPMVDLVSFVLDDAQATWADLFAQRGERYRPAHLVLFRGETQSACGLGAAAMGPFYCSRDERVYIDLSFYDELRQRFGAPGDFAQAYVIAHELGHHVQNLLGISERVERAGRAEGASGMSVRLELQADCLAGVWARRTHQRNLLEPGDLEEAINAAAAIGDDRLQRESSGAVTPETWTHGSSAERVRWLKLGYEQGELDGCDTFSARQL